MSDAWTQPATFLFLAAFLAAPVTVACGWWKTKLTAPAAMVTTALAFLAALWGWHDPGEPVDLAWAPAWNMRFTIELDGLAVLYALMATGIGLAVVIYAGAYMPRHLHHEHRAEKDIVSFFGFLLLFMGAMVGLVMARDLMLIFVFWDLTAIASYFLIGYDRQHRDSRTAALMALIVTAVTAIAFLIAAMLIQHETGSFSIDAAFATMQPNRTATVVALSIAIAGLAKSAQSPLHFWLPRAMAAPTPVSAYLHSAAMVAAGVFLISRFHPLIALSPGTLDLLIVIGFVSMAVGGIISLTRDVLKQILAYSTISQYGYVVVLLGLGTPKAAAAACFYVIAHALAKSALFLTAGAVTESTGTKYLHETGGLWRKLPLLAIGSGLAAAALAALPGVIGFFKDELFFAAALERGGVIPALSVAGAALTVAYTGRFWIGIFLGKQHSEAQPIPARLVWPILLLGLLSLIEGWWPDPVLRLTEHAGEAVSGVAYHLHVGYTLKATDENVMALLAIGAGALLLITRRFWLPAARGFSRLGERVGPEHVYYRTLVDLNRLSDATHSIEVRDLRSRVSSVLPPAAFLVTLGLIFSRSTLTFEVGSMDRDQLFIALMIGIAALSALSATWRENHLTLALMLSGVGFSLSVVYALLGAPDVALVAVLVETIFTLLFLGMLAMMPSDIDPATVQSAVEDGEPASEPGRGRSIIIALIGGLFAFVVAWTILSQPAPLEGIGQKYVDLTPIAHGKDIVTVILADFRGFDTMGEITVIGIAFLGIATLLRRFRIKP
jgi:multicomponent Na+:H+ antiporter subunit A